MADDFKVKVTADLDTSQLEAKLNALQNKPLNIRTNVNGNGISNLDNSIQQIQSRTNDLSASFKGIAATKIKIDSLNFLKSQTENAVRSVTDLNKAMTLVNMTMSNMSSSSLTSNNTPILGRTYGGAIHTIIKRVNKSREKDNKPLMPLFNSHMFRHTFATRYFEAGMPPKTVQNILGHTTIDMTMNVYTSVTEDKKNEDMKLLEDTMKSIVNF